MPPTSTQTSSTSTTTEQTPIRLPTNLIEPINYNLFIKSYFDPYNNDTSKIERFEGRVILRFKVKRNTKFFRIHAAYSIVFLNQIFKIQNLNGKEIELTIQRLENELISFSSSEFIQIGEYTMSLNYSSNYGSSNGFYLSKYKENNQTM